MAYLHFKSNIGMTILDNGNLGVINIVEFDEVEDNAEAEDLFFADPSSETKKHIVPIITGLTNENEILHSSKWTDGEDVNVNWERFPEDMIETIKKSCLKNHNEKAKWVDPELFVYNDIKTLKTLIAGEHKDFVAELDKTLKGARDLDTQLKKYKQADGVSDIHDFLERYYFKKHILIQGAKGGGKTYAVDQMLREKNIPFEFLAGHEGVDATDLVGYSLPSVSGSVWLDGPLTRAFRKAQDEPVALFIDETLRVPAKELNVLVGAITPTSVGTYRLRTSHLINIEDGIGETEVLEVPMENLWVIGTTNVGAGYQVDEIDEALSDRFILVNKITSNSELEQILFRCAEKNGISDDMVHSLVSFYIQMHDLVLAGELEREVNTRHLCETLQYANNDDEVKAYLFDRMPSWTSTDVNGQPNKAEVKIITKLIKRTIKG